MSMVRCDECDKPFDSDFDMDCFNDFDKAICENCRYNANERAWERHQTQDGEPPITDRERYVAAWHEHKKGHKR